MSFSRTQSPVIFHWLNTLGRDLKGIPVENIEVVGGESYQEWLTDRVRILGMEPRTFQLGSRTANHHIILHLIEKEKWV